MRAVLSSIGALLISAAILLAGGGLLGTLVAVSAELQGFPIVAIGFLSSAYFAGFMGGCLATPYLVKRVGHVRVFAALSSLVAACALTHSLLINIPSWLVLRVLTGFSFAGLYMLIESWINEQSPNDKRGQVLSIYRMVDLMAVTVGQFLLSLGDPKDFVLFSVVAILISLAIFPISVSTSKTPISVTQTKLNIKKLVKISPLAVVGCFAVGLSSGAFWGLAPVFVQQLGHPILIVSAFMSAVVFAGAVMQWPVGWLSDKIGRRKALIFAAFGGVGSGIFLWQFAGQSLFMMMTGGVLYGMFAMQIFGMAAAHANDYAQPDEFVSISGGLLLIYAVGSVLGPMLAPIVMSIAGPSSMFAYTAAIHALLAVYGLYRLSQRDAPENSIDYVAVPRPRAALLILRTDPRNLLKRKKKTPKPKR
ncbi:MAG: MFS transporter [Maricaulaceae bacterium]